MDKAEAEAKAKAIADALGWEEKFYLISAASQQGVKDLCWDVMTFIIENPIVHAQEEKAPEKVEFMWDDYHRQQLEEAEVELEDDEDWDDDWDEDDEEGVEFIYKRYAAGVPRYIADRGDGRTAARDMPGSGSERTKKGRI